MLIDIQNYGNEDPIILELFSSRSWPIILKIMLAY